jgi:hypothetical protein
MKRAALVIKKLDTMTVKNGFFATLLLLLAAAACHKDCPAPVLSVRGDWRWDHSTGGLGGWTVTPATQGYTKRVLIDDFWYREYRNDTLFFESQYDIEVRQDSFFGANTYLRFSNGGEYAYVLRYNELDLYEQCFDCFAHFFVRE